jgi:hypothetical protein
MQKPTKQDLFIWFLELKPHPVHGNTYFLWERLNAVVDTNDIYDMPYVKYVDWCHVNNFKFETDWNWLMHLAKQVRVRILGPMDADMNNFTHEQYQNLKGYFIAQLEDVNKEKLYAACTEIIDWWFLVTKYRERQLEKAKSNTVS